MTDTRVCPLNHRDGAPELDPDAYVCRTCTGRLRGLLTDLPGLFGDLDTTLTRQAVFTTRYAGTGPTTPDPDDEHPAPQTAATTPLVVHLGAADALFVTRNTLLAWADWVTAVRGHHLPTTWARIADYLRDAARWLSQHPDGPQVVDELTAALRHARATIDRPADRAFIGTCGALIETAMHLGAVDDTGAPVLSLVPTSCTEQLYAREGRPVIDCPRCGTTWDVAARQQALLEQLEDHVLPAVDIARAVDGLGVPVTADRIRQWKRRRLLAVALDDHGRPRADVRGRPLYRVGDVLDLVAGHSVSVAGGSVPS